MRIEIKDIKKDQVFFERFDTGEMVEFKATTNPVKEVNNVGTQWSIKGVDKQGNEIDFLVTEQFAHYGPRLYNTKNG